MFKAPVQSVSLHPNTSNVSVGLASGHVIVQTYGTVGNGVELLKDAIWNTRRHKGACRGVEFSQDGQRKICPR